MKKYIKPTPVFHDSPLPLMTNTISGSNMPWEAKKQYIPPYIDFSEIEEEEELMQGSNGVEAGGSDMPWGAKQSYTDFSIDDNYNDATDCFSNKNLEVEYNFEFPYE